MCCPYFLPARHLGGLDGGSGIPPPLGDEWEGACRSACDAPVESGPLIHRRDCNFGYARGNCPRFPAGDGPDAVRFAISSDDGDAILVRFVVERDHHPFANGSLEYRRKLAEFVVPPTSDLLRSQARAYTESYLRRVE